MIIVTGAIHATEDHFAEMLAASLEHCRRSRTEPGCIAHNVHRDCEDPCRLVFLEYWDSAEALKAHFAVPAARAFVAYAREHAAEPPEVNVLKAERVEMTGTDK